MRVVPDTRAPQPSLRIMRPKRHILIALCAAPLVAVFPAGFAGPVAAQESRHYDLLVRGGASPIGARSASTGSRRSAHRKMPPGSSGT